MGTSRFSSDLDMGRRPKLKSDENKEVPILYIEILKCEHFFTVKKVLHLIGASVPESVPSIEMVGEVKHFMGQHMCDYICRQTTVGQR